MPAANGNFTATGSSAEFEGSSAELAIGGTFVATVKLEMAIPGVAGADLWVPVGTALTAPGVAQFNSPTNRKFRVTCGPFTSGTAHYSGVASRSRHSYE